MVLNNMTLAELQDLLLEETKKHTHSMSYGTSEQYETDRKKLKEIIEAIEEIKKKNVTEYPTSS